MLQKQQRNKYDCKIRKHVFDYALDCNSSDTAAREKNYMKETIQIRCAIEGFCTQCLAADVNTARGQKTIRELGNILDLQRHAVEEDDNYESFIDYDHQFHLLLVQYIKNEEVNNIFQRLMYL